MAICIRCRQPNTWLELKLTNFGDGNNFVGWQGVRREIGGGGVSGFGGSGESGRVRKGQGRRGREGKKGKNKEKQGKT